MSHVPARLTDFLDRHSIAYDVIRYRCDVHALQAARDVHVPDHQFAKTVFIRSVGDPAMAVLPASRSLSPSRLARALCVPRVELLKEPESAALCPDCEVGAAPPSGSLYGLPLYASPALAQQGAHRLLRRHARARDSHALR